MAKKSTKSPVQKTAGKVVKVAAKKPAVRKAAAPQPSAGKTVAKKTAKKSAVTSGPAKKADKPVPAKAAKVKKVVKHVPPRIVKRPAAVVRSAEEGYQPIDTAKAVAFAMSIAEEKKRTAAKAEENRMVSEIRLSKRPTTRAQGKTTNKFPANDLRDFRKRLLAARTAALNGMTAMKATGFNESDDHEADGGDGTNQTLRLQALGQMGNINRTIQQIDEALHRIDDGSYGVCTSCGQLIRKPRLLNQPFVLTCMECQSEMERGGK